MIDWRGWPYNYNNNAHLEGVVSPCNDSEAMEPSLAQYHTSCHASLNSYYHENREARHSKERCIAQVYMLQAIKRKYYNTLLSSFCSVICQVVAYGRLKTN